MSEEHIFQMNEWMNEHVTPKVTQSYPKNNWYPGNGSLLPKNGLHRSRATEKRVNKSVAATDSFTREQ